MDYSDPTVLLDTYYTSGGCNADWNSTVWFITDTVVIFDNGDDYFDVIYHAWDDDEGESITETLFTGTAQQCINFCAFYKDAN